MVPLRSPNRIADGCWLGYYAPSFSPPGRPATDLTSLLRPHFTSLPAFSQSFDTTPKVRTNSRAPQLAFRDHEDTLPANHMLTLPPRVEGYEEGCPGQAVSSVYPHAGQGPRDLEDGQDDGPLRIVSELKLCGNNAYVKKYINTTSIDLPHIPGPTSHDSWSGAELRPCHCLSNRCLLYLSASSSGARSSTSTTSR